MIIALPVYYIGDYCKASENIMVLVINTGVLMAIVLISRTEFLYGVYKFLARKELILNITFILVMFIYGYCMYRIKDSSLYFIKMESNGKGDKISTGADKIVKSL